MSTYLVPGIIITGGNPIQTAGVSVEVFNPHTKQTCRLPDLPGDVRSQHSLCGRLLCGGWDSSTARSCLKLNLLTGVFTPTSVSLVENRTNHLCWDVEGEEDWRQVEQVVTLVKTLLLLSSASLEIHIVNNDHSFYTDIVTAVTSWEVSTAHKLRSVSSVIFLTG